MRKLVYKTMVDAIEPMDADTLECVRVCGWRVVCRKGDFHVGDIALYIEPDAALSPHDDRFAFLRDRCYKKFNVHGKLFDECYRIKTMKLRGVISQGLLMKPELFCEVRNKQLHEDCSDVLAVRHYDEVAEKYVNETAPLKPADQKGPFPEGFGPKTDEERIQNIEDETLRSWIDSGEELEVTQKIDGTSMSVGYAPIVRLEDPLAVCSRNFELKDMPSSYWDMVHQLRLDERLKEYCERYNLDLLIQGELHGPGISSNRDHQTERHFSVFRIWDIQEQRYLEWDERMEICRRLGLEHVPVLEITTLRRFTDPYDPDNMQAVRDNILKFAEGKTELGNEREGVVFKSRDGHISFKAVSNAYLLGLK